MFIFSNENHGCEYVYYFDLDTGDIIEHQTATGVGNNMCEGGVYHEAHELLMAVATNIVRFNLKYKVNPELFNEKL